MSVAKALSLLFLAWPALATISVIGTPATADFTAASMAMTIPSTTAGDAVLFALQYRSNSTDTTTSVTLGAATCTHSIGRATYTAPRSVEFELCVNVPGGVTTATIVQSGTGTVTITSIEVHSSTGTLSLDTSGAVSNGTSTGGSNLSSGPALTTTGTNSGLFLYICSAAASSFVSAVAPWSALTQDFHSNPVTQLLNQSPGSYTGGQNWGNPTTPYAASSIALKEPAAVAGTEKHRSKIISLSVPIVTPATINYISSAGNSNSNGYGATPALTTAQPYANLMLGSPSGPNFIPLIEGTGNTTGGTNVESPLSMTGNQITKQSAGYVAAVYNNSLIGGDYAGVARGTATYNAGLTSISTSIAAAAALGQPFQVAAAIYMAGGTDFGEAVPAATYQANMVAYQANWQTDVFALTHQSGTLPLFLDINSKWTEQGPPAARETPTYAAGGNGIQFGVIAAWQANQGKIYIIGPHYQQTFIPSGFAADHTDNISNRNYGEKTGQVLKKVLVDHQAWVPLVPRAISISGATITFQCWVPAPPLVIDTTSVPDWTGAVGSNGAFRYKGFEFFDDSGAPPHITAVVVSAADTLTITLASTPTGTAGSFRLRYDYTGTLNTIQGTAAAPGGNVRDSDATPSVFGDPLYNWLIGPQDNPIPYTFAPSLRSLK